MSESSLKKILLGVFDGFLAIGAEATASDKTKSVSLVEADGLVSSLLTVFDESSSLAVARFAVALGTRTRRTSFFLFGGGFPFCVGSCCASTGALAICSSRGFSRCFLVTFCCLAVLAFGFSSMLFSSSGSVVIVCVLSFGLDCAVSMFSCTCCRTTLFGGKTFFRAFSAGHTF